MDAMRNAEIRKKLALNDACIGHEYPMNDMEQSMFPYSVNPFDPLNKITR